MTKNLNVKIIELPNIPISKKNNSDNKAVRFDINRSANRLLNQNIN